MRLIERLVNGWLRRVAPRQWPDAMEGDLNEEAERGTRRLWTALQLSRIAARFTGDKAKAAWRNRAHRQKGTRAMTIGSDIRHAGRSLLRAPGFSLVAIATLALAIGANTAIYSALSALVLNPLPFKDGHRFVFVWHRMPDMPDVLVAPARAAFDQWRRAPHIFESVDNYTTRSVVMTGHGEPRELDVSMLSPSALTTMGIQPEIGRPFVEADHAKGAPPVLLIGHALWTRTFSRDAGVVGTSITLNGVPHTIIGVMPRKFRLPMMGSDEMWAPAQPGPATTRVGEVFAKLAPGVTVAQARSALDALPDAEGLKGYRGVIREPSEQHGATTKTAMLVLSGAVGLLLLIACVNVANLLLSRHSSRRREIAVRHALGASRARLARYLLVESLLLAIAGGAAGLVIANLGLSAMAKLRSRDLEMLADLRLEPDALLFAAAVTLVTGVLFGAAPALAASRANLQDILKSGGRTATGSGHRARAVLTVAQVSLALMLLVGATLLLKSYARVSSVNPGYNPANVLAMKLSLPASRYPAKEIAKRRIFYEQTLAAVRALPGVRSAAIGNGAPPEAGVVLAQLHVEGSAPLREHTILAGGYISPGYFSTLGIPLLEGRDFSDTDVDGGELVVIAGETLARKFWPGQSPVGRRIRLRPNGPWATVVGKAGDVKALGLGTTSGSLQLYQPRSQMTPDFGAIIVRADGDPRTLVPQLKAAVWAQDPLLPLRDAMTAEQLLGRSIGSWRFNLALLAVLAGCGLVLAIVGVYGVTAIFVGQRQREVGIRMALGATRAAVASLVLRQTVLMLGCALTIGTAGAWWLSRYLQTLVFQTPTRDLVSFMAAAVGIAVAALAATVIPLRRATSVDPATVLRAE